MMNGGPAETLLSAVICNNARDEFRRTTLRPRPHAVMDGLLQTGLARQCFEEFNALDLTDATRYTDPDFEFGKTAVNDAGRFPPTLGALIQDLQTDYMVSALQHITGYRGLMTDLGLWGGGLHVTAPGGYLAIHRDFSVLPPSYSGRVQWRRVLNLIGYFNLGLEPSWGGELELWDNAGTGARRRIAPAFNRWVLFDTRGTYHGHPYPWHGPRPRFSVAVYYYVAEEVPMSEWTSTEFLRLPGAAETLEYEAKRAVRADPRARYAQWWPA